MEKPILYIVIPCYNEEEVLPITSGEFLAKINELADLGKISNESRVLFVNDGSRDRTWEIITELAQKGYGKASLRIICRNAGVTTGALYFHYENKEALLKAILEPLIARYESLMAEYMGMELEAPEKGADIDVLMMSFILEHRKEAIIIMEKAQGSCYEGWHKRIEAMMGQAVTTFYRSRMNEEPDKELIRILARTRLDGCLEILKGNYDMEYSLYLTKKLGVYATGGTEKLIKELNEFHG